MQETQFLTSAKKTILYIGEQIEYHTENNLIEVDILSNEVLSIITPKGQYVINKQTPARELWIASPISGPYHFGYVNGKWQSKNGTDLFTLLNEELKAFCLINLQYDK